MASIYDFIDKDDDADDDRAGAGDGGDGVRVDAVEVESSYTRAPGPRIIVAYGTRPERIKLEPVVAALRDRGCVVEEWRSGQSRDLVDDPNMRPEFWRYSLAAGIATCLEEFHDLVEHEKPTAVIVQGDTATAFACAQAAFLARVPVAHVEAGLRTYASEPWPEEGFRRQIAAVARWHFAPDEPAAENLVRELNRPLSHWSRRDAGIFVTGNTVIDTLGRAPFRVLATLHRRENWYGRRRRALATLARVARSHDDVELAIIAHPNGGDATGDYAGAIECADFLVEPVPHEKFLEMMQLADVIVTDSGGLQEEAAHFGIKTLVVRSSTERVALERAGAITLVDPDDENALERELASAIGARRCYGDGTAGARIADILVKELAKEG